MDLSVVVPVYSGEKTIEVLLQQLCSVLEPQGLKFEVIFVEDRSTDRSWPVIEELCRSEKRLKGLRLARNFGQHAAITAGLEKSSGHYVVVMDCDLQDDPRYIVRMLEMIRGGTDVVLTLKKNRAHSMWKNILACIYHRVFNWLSDREGIYSDPRIGSYSLLTRKVVDSFLQFEDRHRHYLYILRWMGFSTTCLEIEHKPREQGRSTYTFSKLFVHAIDGIVSQSNRLLYAALGFGVFFVILAFVALGWLLVNYFMHGSLQGWTSTIAVILLGAGLNLLMVGILGLYLAKVFDQVRARPTYIVDESLNF